MLRRRRRTTNSGTRTRREKSPKGPVLARGLAWPDEVYKGYLAKTLQAIEGPALQVNEELLPLGMTQSDRRVGGIRRIVDHDGVGGRRDLSTCAAFARPASMPDQLASPVSHLTPK